MSKKFVKYNICLEKDVTDPNNPIETGRTRNNVIETLELEPEWIPTGEIYCDANDAYRQEKECYIDYDVIIEDTGNVRTNLVEEDSLGCGGGIIDQKWELVSYVWDNLDKTLTRKDVEYVIWKDEPDEWECTYNYRYTEVEFIEDWRLDSYSWWYYSEERNEVYRFPIYRLWVQPKDDEKYEWIETNITEQSEEAVYYGSKDGILLIFNNPEYELAEDNGYYDKSQTTMVRYYYYYYDDKGKRTEGGRCPYDNCVHIYENGLTAGIGATGIRQAQLTNGYYKNHYVKIMPITDETTSLNGTIWDFYTSNPVVEIDTRNWNIHSGITTMVRVFSELTGCEVIKGLEDWDVSNVVNMSEMFYHLHTIKELNIWDWDVSNVVNMSEMFKGCTELETVDLSKWNTSNVKWMNYMLEDCTSIKYLDMSNLDLTSLEIEEYSYPNGYSNIAPLWNMKNLETFKVDNIKLKIISSFTLDDIFGSLSEDYTYGSGVYDYFMNFKPNWTITSNYSHSVGLSMLDKADIVETADYTDLILDNVYISSFYNAKNLKTIILNGINFSDYDNDAFSYFLSNLPSLTDVYLNGCTFPSRENDRRLAYICNNLKRIHMCGCDEDSIRFIRQGLDNSDYTDVMILTAEENIS